MPAMVDAMLGEMNQKHGRRVAAFTPAYAGAHDEQHEWPGNARELRNLMERAVILCPDGGAIDVDHLPARLWPRSQFPAVHVPDANSVSVRVGSTVDEAERLLILRTLEFTGQNKTRAAEILGVSLKTLHNKLKEYDSSARARDKRGRRRRARIHEPEDQTRSGHHRAGLPGAAVLSLVYVSQLLQAVVQQSYDTNVLGAEQIRYALQLALETGLKDQKVDPNNQLQLRDLAATAVRNSVALKAVVDSVNRYSPRSTTSASATINNKALLSTNPVATTSRCPVRPTISSCVDSNPIQLLKAVFGPPKVYDVVLPLERNGRAFATVHVGVRTTLLRGLRAAGQTGADADGTGADWGLPWW
jgi:transposase